jgi:hypothetical protein
MTDAGGNSQTTAFSSGTTSAVSPKKRGRDNDSDTEAVAASLKRRIASVQERNGEEGGGTLGITFSRLRIRVDNNTPPP